MIHANLQTKRARLMALAAQAATPARPKLGPAITDLIVHPVREPVSKREYVLVELRTDSGLAGIGEAAAAGSDALSIAAGILAQKAQLVGRDAVAAEPLRLALLRGGESSTMLAAQAALNMAQLDIAGKLARAPVYEVLGGPTRFKARAGALIEASDVAGSLGRARTAGFRAIFLPLTAPEFRNSGQAFVHGTRRRLDQLRKTAGDDMDFVLDCGGTLTPGDAQMLAREMESFHLLWLEEPCPALNLNAVAKISGESVTPVGFGRHFTSNAQFQELLRNDAIDILRPDIGRYGISQARKSAALAETYYTAVAPFHRGGPVATAACLQLAASIPNFFLQEIPLPAAEADRRMRVELVSAPIESVKEGFLPLPTGPGLGITLNTDALQKYRAV
jgi:galactonate dehydratase